MEILYGMKNKSERCKSESKRLRRWKQAIWNFQSPSIIIQIHSPTSKIIIQNASFKIENHHSNASSKMTKYLEAILWLPSRVMTCLSELWVRNFLSGTGSSTKHLSRLTSELTELTELGASSFALELCADVPSISISRI